MKNLSLRIFTVDEAISNARVIAARLNAREAFSTKRS